MMVISTKSAPVITGNQNRNPSGEALEAKLASIIRSGLSLTIAASFPSPMAVGDGTFLLSFMVTGIPRM
jgi:hypothetical protein